MATINNTSHESPQTHSTAPSHPPSSAAAVPAIPSTLPPLPPLFRNPSSSPPPTLIAQGAEALLYKTSFIQPSLSCALKHRPSKPYRHPILDARLTRHRILAEARALAKCRREGLAVPAVYALDAHAGWLALEWIEGTVVKERLREWYRGRAKGRGLVSAASGAGSSEVSTDSYKKDGNNSNGTLEETNESKSDKIYNDDDEMSIETLLAKIGTAVGALHRTGYIHGDLTTSNMILQPPKSQSQWQSQPPATPTHAPTPSPPLPSSSHTSNPQEDLTGEILLIDFGLASQSSLDEDRAVDLYVLERAFGSTHPAAELRFGSVLDAYGRSYKGAHVVLKRLEDVRMRGRKRSMLG